MKASVVVAIVGLALGCARTQHDSPSPSPVARVVASPLPDQASLRALYSAPVPELIAKLKDPSLFVRATAAAALGHAGARAEVAVPMLVESLADPSEEVARCAADALGQIGLAARVAAPALDRALGSPHPGLRRSAAWALGRIGAGEEVVPALLRAYDTEDYAGHARAAALLSLVSIAPSRTETLATLSRALDDKRSRVRDAALDGYGALPTLPESAVVELGWRLEAGDAGSRIRIVALLQKARSAAALPGLYGLLPEASESLRRKVAAAIVAIRTP